MGRLSSTVDLVRRAELDIGPIRVNVKGVEMADDRIQWRFSVLI